MMQTVSSDRMGRQASLGHYVDVVRVLVARELAVRFKGSTLGLAWTIVTPLATVAILYFLFTRILPLNISYYSSHIYTGLLPWTWLSASVFGGAATLLDHRDLVRKPFFARPLLPLTVVATNFLLYLLALPVLLALLLIEGLTLPATLLLLPIIWIIQAILALALSMLLAALSVLVRDIEHILGVVMLLWFYLTPIFYDIDNLSPTLRTIYAFNPMSVIVLAHRAVCIDGTAPDWYALSGVAAASMLLLALGIKVFHELEDLFVDEL
jgi:lipopolysaccharide transport system permease protein